MAMGIIVMLPLMFVGSFLLGQGFPQANPQRARIIGGSILGLILLIDIVLFVVNMSSVPRH
jgi:hypothetical protein